VSQPRLRRLAAFLLIAAISLVAVAVRVPNLRAGYPYMAYVDEGNYLWHARNLYGHGGWDPQAYMYPSLPLYAACATAWTADRVRGALGLPLIRDGAAKPFYGRYDPFDPPQFLLAGRAACLVASLLAIGLAGWLAARWFGRAAGACAALAAALTPALVARGGIAMVDVWSGLFVLACLLAADLLWTTPSRRTLAVLAAGLCAGLAGASKYPAVLIAAAPALAILLTRRGWGDVVRQLAVLGAGVLTALAVAMPALWLRTAGVMKALGDQARLYSTLPWTFSYFHQAVVRMEESLPFEVPELGWLLLLLIALGTALVLADRRLRARVAGPLLAAALLLGLQLRFGYQPFRNLVPLVPLAVVFAVAPLGRLPEGWRWKRITELAAAGALVLLLLPSALSIARQRYALTDSRVEARRWLAAHVRPGDRILVEDKLRFLDSELARIPAEVVVARGGAAARSDAPRDFRYVLAGQRPFADAVVAGLPHGAARRAFRRAASFGSDPVLPVEWWFAGNHLRINILESIVEAQVPRSGGPDEPFRPAD
jgi:4-amino-4-deoxy-L-arabinose transferase-like glycosyltransferase